MNALDDLLADTAQVGGLAPTAIEQGRTQLDEQMQYLQNRGSASASAGRSRRRIGLMSAAGIAASAAVVAALMIGSNQPGTTPIATDASTPAAGASTVTSDSPPPVTNTIQLAGYQLALPAKYTLGQTDTSCTADLHLSADETKRLVTTPAPGCPLLVTSVQRDLPPDANKFSHTQGNHDGTTVASFIGWLSEQTNEFYLPTKLPDGTTVYVTLDWSDVSPGQANVEIDGAPYSTTQLEEFEQGVTVTPTSQLPTSTATPVDKPTVNCDANCGH